MSPTAPRPARRLAFRVSYDGTAYHGWQSQPTGVPTIQSELERAFSDFVGHPVRVDGASRTDAGVHARDQLAAVTTGHPALPAGLVRAVNKRLPSDISIFDARVVDPDYNPRFANRGKTYCYRLFQGRTREPLLERFAWRVPWSLDPERWIGCVPHLMGEHDFTSFAASDGTHRHAVRTIWRVSITRERYVWEIRFSGNSFLKYMIRNLVGTLVEVGCGRWEPDRLRDIIAARSRSAAGRTAPSAGLELERMLLIEPTGVSPDGTDP